VGQIAGNLAMTADSATVEFGRAASFTAQLSAQVPVAVAPTGQIRILDGANILLTYPVSTNQISAVLPLLPVGVHRISAAYSGDQNWSPSASATILLSVTKASTSTVLSGSFASPVTLTATVTSTPAGASGLVQFSDTSTQAVLGTAQLAAGAVSASLPIPTDQARALVGHPIVAVYAGDANFTTSTSSAIGIPLLVNAAGGYSASAAPEEFVSLFGYQLADRTEQAGTVPLPNPLGGATITVTDSSGTPRPAGLSYASPSQINLLIPAGTAIGPATLGLKRGTIAVLSLPLTVTRVAPGIFTASADGHGAAAAQLIRVHADGTQTTESTQTGIKIGAEPVYLILYTTGLRNRSDAANVTCTIGGITLPADYAAAQPGYPGLDQVNILLPAKLAGAGVVDVVLTVDGINANTVTLTFL
jgi:uncharacterized protein (TIGR03437 family)